MWLGKQDGGQESQSHSPSLQCTANAQSLYTPCHFHPSSVIGYCLHHWLSHISRCACVSSKENQTYLVTPYHSAKHSENVKWARVQFGITWSSELRTANSLLILTKKTGVSKWHIKNKTTMKSWVTGKKLKRSLWMEDLLTITECGV